jgi:hypothetical protein
MDRWTPSGGLMRALWQQARAPAIIVAAIAISVFFTTAEAVVDSQLTHDVLVCERALEGLW